MLYQIYGKVNGKKNKYTLTKVGTFDMGMSFKNHLHFVLFVLSLCVYPSVHMCLPMCVDV